MERIDFLPKKCMMYACLDGQTDTSNSLSRTLLRQRFGRGFFVGVIYQT